ncbi:Receptor-type tyrosine-protein phosphatase alpha [Taenia crassiceps]|uniref:Receptor-type tyrosine-protein phosphatase alpha n=1 Tax=Taenia crassiceps TaxID=6207 RepID=A0ABR4Q0Y9_9CEST
MDVYVEGVDEDWIQLSWPPPKVRRPATPPIGYIISVRRGETCWEREVILSAPWITQRESAFIRQSAERLTSAHRCDGEMSRVVEGRLDGFWPDFPGSRRQTWVQGWNRADVDEQGPLGIFAVTTGNLRRNTLYNFAITPVFHPDVNILAESTSIEARTASSSASVSLEVRGNSAWIYKHGAYELTISEIGAHSIHCNNSTPIFNNGAAERQCRKSTHNTRQRVEISLTSSSVYRLVVSPINSGRSFKKVFRISPDQLKFRPQIKAIALSSNLVYISVAHLNITVPNPLAFIARICQTKDPGECKRHPLYYEVVGSYSLYQNRSAWQVNQYANSSHFTARIQPTTNTHLQVSLHAYPADASTGEELLLATTTSETRKHSCTSWCIWPAGDWSNTHGSALGEYDREFARRTADDRACESYCEPLLEAIDGESGCLTVHKYMEFCSLPLCSAVAPIGCATDADSTQGISWISIEWKNPRETFTSFPKFLILVTSRHDVYMNQVFIETSPTVLPPFLRTAVQSLPHSRTSLITEDTRRVNITNLAQNTDYNISIIPYLLEGSIGAVLVRTVKTKVGAPCRVEGAQLRQNGSEVDLKWKLILERTCSPPTNLVVEINGTRRDDKLSHPFEGAHLTHNFEFCRTYQFRLRFESPGGMRPYPHTLSSEIGYPDIDDKAPITYLTDGKPYFRVSFASEHLHCEYEYALRWGVWPNFTFCRAISASPTGNALTLLSTSHGYTVREGATLPKLREGFVYSVNARVQPRGSTSHCRDAKFASAWSKLLAVPTALCKSVLEAKEESSSGCLLPHAEYNGRQELRVVENGISPSGQNVSICTIVAWTVDATSAGSVLGYIVEITQSAARRCRLIWLPCEACFPGYGLGNVLPAVEQELRRIEAQCTKASTQLLQHAERLDSQLYKTTIRLVLGFQSIGETNGTFTGVVRVHAVKMGSVHQIMEQYWQTDAKVVLSKRGFRTGLITGILAIVLITIMIVLIVMRRQKAKIIRQDQYTKVCSEDEDALEADSIAILSKKFGTRPRRPPSPIHLSDFVKVVANYAINDYAILREEFKTLQCNAAVQQEEKGLTMEVGVHPENHLRNRYKNVLPFDQNRLKLTSKYALVELCPPGDVDPKATPIALNAVSDYVNASLIPSTPPPLRINYATVKPHCRSSPTFYVAAQAPKRCSVGLFWQAIWDSNVRVIIMLTRLYEREKEKCWPYWPRKQDGKEVDGDGGGLNGELCSSVYGNFAVTLQSTETGLCYIRRVLVVRNKVLENDVPRRVIQLLMTSWDDFKVPRKDDFYIFLKKYWEELKTMTKQSSGSVLVHCSAGVGRTGTFIAIDMLARYIQRLVQMDDEESVSNAKAEEDDASWHESVYANLTASGKAILLHNRATLDKSTPTVDVFETVLWLRSQRLKTVQQDIQYIFIYDFLSYYIQSLMGETEIPYDSV